MAKRMLIDATHPDETRVVVVSNGKVEEFDYETAAKAQLKGNIYLAKVTKVEPSLQAAFVDYGGNRHGFLPFSEIHPDYYRIPIADREALLAEEEALRAKAEAVAEEEAASEADDDEDEDERAEAPARGRRRRRAKPVADEDGDEDNGVNGGEGPVEEIETEGSVDTVGGDEVEEAARRRAKLMRRYKIQEVIKRKQVMLVQVTKEERGTKGAALTTYLSLAGRYCVLMPNTAKGGGISRKIGNAADRKRLKSVLSELEIPEGMAVIVRTAGAQRTKAEIRRDYEYLLRLWDDIRTKTLESTAPALIHEEANLIKRAIRDLYTRDTEEILVEGEEGYKAAKGFMKMLMPSHARNVKHYADTQIPLLYRYEVEQQLDLMHEPEVRLKSGGSIVINPTEALVAIDVNSGKATRERHIEETALKTNLEAADEVARQLRLRDFAGLIVIDFIDMEEPRHNREVERRLKEAMKADRARIQLGRISPFGLLELSRQRLRPSLFETETEVCQACRGTGFLRSDNSASRHVLRAITEEAIKRGGGEVVLTVPTSVALYLLNDRREAILDLERRYGLGIAVRADQGLLPPDYEMKRLSSEGTPPAQLPAGKPAAEEEESEEAKAEEERRTSRRGRRGGRKRRGEEEARAAETREEDALTEAAGDGAAEVEAESRYTESDEEQDEDRKAKRRRRGKRGGRRRSKTRQAQDEQGQDEQGQDEQDRDAEDQDEHGRDARAEESDSREAEPWAEAAAEATPGETLQAQPAAQPAAQPGAETAGEPEAAPADEAAAGEASADAESQPAPEEKPKRRTRRPRRKAAPEAEREAVAPEATGAEATGAEAPATEAPAAETPAAEATGPETPAAEERKPKRRSPARKRTKPAAETPAAEAPAAEAPVAEDKPAADQAASAEAAPQPQAESKTETAAEDQTDAAAERTPEPATAGGEPERPESGLRKSGPKRRGWWNRIVG